MLFREAAGRDVAELTPDSHVIAVASDIIYNIYIYNII
ncbi:hypothetical protein BN130_1869 [Cronobacter malonaticus 507]|nr:hypothetical protein BN130_1869 [Cronobacter malonaticus 507]